MTRRLLAAIGFSLCVACTAESDVEVAREAVSANDTLPVSVLADSVPSAPVVAGPAIAPPRRAAALSLVEIWRVGGPDDPGELVQPVHLFASHLGVMVSELDGAHVRVYSARDGGLTDTIGRYGFGPGEFGRVPQLLGSFDQPMAFEGANARLSLLSRGQPPKTSRVASGRSWVTACALEPGRILLQVTGWNDDGYVVSTVGDSARVIDSLAHPFAELRDVLPIARQASLHQVDDSTCAILPGYAQRFAVLRSGRLTFGDGIEPAPIPAAAQEGEGVGSRRGIASGTRPTNQSAASWNGRLLLLHNGRTALRRRLVDIYASDLRYESSLALPFDATYIAVLGDTLFALGEVEDEPVLAAFVLRRR
jgi:hypothetical protein